MRWFPLAFTLLAVVAPVQAAPLSMREFGEDMLAQVQKAMPGRQVALDPVDPLKATIAARGKDEELTLFFDRVWRQCQQVSEEECRQSRADFVAKMLAPRPAITARSLRFVVRDRQYAMSVRAMDNPAKGQVAAYMKPIGDDLFMILAADAKDSVALVGSQALKDIGLSEDDAWLIAVPQTRSVLPKIADAGALGQQWHAYQGQAYLGSMLGLTDDWAQLSAELGPDLFAAVPSDQLAVFGKVAEGEPLARLRSGAQNDCNAAPRCISPNVYRFKDGRWVVAN